MAEGFATRAIHAGRLPLPAEPRWPPRSGRPRPSSSTTPSTTPTPSASRGGYVYTRYENPTTAALEATVADLEGRPRAWPPPRAWAPSPPCYCRWPGPATTSPSATCTAGPSLLAHTAPRFGIEVSFVDAGDPGAVRAALRPTTRAIYAETVANPTMTVADLPALADAGAAQACPWWSTTPWPRRTCAGPWSTGRPVVVHSATKYLGGHSDVVGGLALFAEPERHRPPGG